MNLEEIEEKYSDILEDNGFMNGRMISHSKSGYYNTHKWHKVVFNANIYVMYRQVPVKIWYGDLDISLDGDKLKEVSKILDTKLYILRESDGRFVDESNVDIEKKSFWNTEEETPYVDAKYIKYKEQESKYEREIEGIYQKISILKNDYTDSKLPIVKELKTIGSRDVISKITFPFKYIKDELGKEKDKYDKFGNKYKKEDNLMVNLLLDKYLIKKFKLKKGREINYSSFWIGENTAEKLRKISFEFESYIGKKYKEDDITILSTYLCVMTKCYTIDEGISIKSYELNTLYIAGEVDQKERNYNW